MLHGVAVVHLPSRDCVCLKDVFIRLFIFTVKVRVKFFKVKSQALTRCVYTEG